MRIKIAQNTAYRWGQPFGSVVEIVEVSVDYGENGYNCWGYRFGSEGALPGALTYDADWTTPGDALNAAHKERNNLNGTD